MDDLISREAAIAIMQAKGEMAMGTPGTVFYSAAHMLEMMPAVDAEPVRHGRWIKKIGCVKCSTCFEDCWADSEPSYEFCPYCGAKMDMEKEKE